jgi:hypothetical protein
LVCRVSNRLPGVRLELIKGAGSVRIPSDSRIAWRSQGAELEKFAVADRAEFRFRNRRHTNWNFKPHE